MVVEPDPSHPRIFLVHLREEESAEGERLRTRLAAAHHHLDQIVGAEVTVEEVWGR